MNIQVRRIPEFEPFSIENNGDPKTVNLDSIISPLVEAGHEVEAVAIRDILERDGEYIMQPMNWCHMVLLVNIDTEEATL